MKHKSVMSCIVGNVLEWYEFTLFAALSPVIAHQFFPSFNPTVSLLNTFFVFAIGFFIRPLGAIVLGYMGDKWGRAYTLKWSICLLSLCSIMTGLLPTYSTIGIWAPVFLIVSRLVQGLCIGGEFAGAMIFLSESSPNDKRAFYSAMTNNGSNIGVLLAISSAYLSTHFYSEKAFYDYAWRYLFILGGVIGLIGMHYRQYLEESDLFKQYQQRKIATKRPTRFVFKYQKKLMLRLSLILVISACGSYTIMNYLSTYLHVVLGASLREAYWYQMGLIILSLFFVPLFARVGDKLGRKPVLMLACLGYIVVSLPLFMGLKMHLNFLYLVPLALLYSAEQAVTPVMLSECFPINARFTGVSMSYNTTMALVGGTAPWINTFLIHLFNTPLTIAFYIMVCASVSLMACYFMVDDAYGESVLLDR